MESISPDSVVILPRAAPEDLEDGFAAAGVVLVLLALGALVVWALSALVSLSVAMLVVVLPGTVWLVLHSVGWLRLDEEGIRFGRRMGSPGFLSWGSIRSIRPATRREVIMQGWLWPPFPPREATRSLSSEGHYRIEWEGGYTFFPPLDEPRFRAAVERWADPAAVQW